MMRLWMTLGLVMTLNAVLGQIEIEWERSFGGTGDEVFSNVLETLDGGYLMVGHTSSNDQDVGNNYGGSDIWVVKVDPFGIIEWERNYGGSGDEYISEGCLIPAAQFGGYVFCATTNSNDFDVNQNLGGTDGWVVQIDVDGTILWDSIYGGSLNDTLAGIDTKNNEYYICGSSRSSDNHLPGNNGGWDYWVLRTGVTGNVLWSNNFGGSSDDVAASIAVGFIDNYVVGTSSSNDLDVPDNFGQEDIWFVRFNDLGAITAVQNYGGSGSDVCEDFLFPGRYCLATVTSNDSMVQNNYGGSDLWLIQLDTNGALLTSQNYGGSQDDEARTIYQLSDGSLLIGGASMSADNDLSQNYGGFDNWIMHLESNGTQNLSRSFGGTISDMATALVETYDGDYIMVGQSSSSNFDVSVNKGGEDLWVVRLDRYFARVEGRVILDFNANCVFDPGDTVFSSAYVRVESSVIPRSIVDDNGFYEIDLPDTTSDWLIRTDFLGYPYMNSLVPGCISDTVKVGFGKPLDTLDIYVSGVQCPMINVDVAVPFLERCSSATYNVTYCNNGSAHALGASVIVDIPASLTFIASDIPPSLINGTEYTFPIGNLNISECGDFDIVTEVRCDSVYIGEAICVTARALPDTFCAPFPTLPSARLEASTECLGDTMVGFRVKNVGNGNMSDTIAIMAIEDIVLKYAAPIHLNAGEEIFWGIPANGLNHRVIAEQTGNHPLYTFTTATESFCNKTIPGPFPGGFAIDTTQRSFAEEEELPFEAVTCDVVRELPLQNTHLNATPEGIDPVPGLVSNVIDSSASVEYLAYFQTNGFNDYIDDVIVRASLHSRLDPGTLRAGSSSHPYTHRFTKPNEVEFRFNNINLADGNNPVSKRTYGYVQFKLDHLPDSWGYRTSVIDVVYDDYGVRDDAYRHYLSRPLAQLDTSWVEVINLKALGVIDPSDISIQLYPNPSSAAVKIQLPDQLRDFELAIYDAQGRVVSASEHEYSRNLIVDVSRFSAGMYQLVLSHQGIPIAGAQLIVQH